MHIFLDIDGVLNNAKNKNDELGLDISPRNVAVLKDLLKKLKSYTIIISSDWKYCLTDLDLFSTYYGILYKDITENISLYNSMSREERRYQEIHKYIKKHKVEDYVIIDDLELDDKNQILTDAKFGLQYKDVETFISSRYN